MFFFIQILKKIFYFKINFLAIINFMNIKFNYIKYFILLCKNLILNFYSFRY